MILIGSPPNQHGWTKPAPCDLVIPDYSSLLEIFSQKGSPQRNDAWPRRCLEFGFGFGAQAPAGLCGNTCTFGCGPGREFKEKHISLPGR